MTLICVRRWPANRLISCRLESWSHFSQDCSILISPEDRCIMRHLRYGASLGFIFSGGPSVLSVPLHAITLAMCLSRKRSCKRWMMLELRISVFPTRGRILSMLDITCWKLSKGKAAVCLPASLGRLISCSIWTSGEISSERAKLDGFLTRIWPVRAYSSPCTEESRCTHGHSMGTESSRPKILAIVRENFLG